GVSSQPFICCLFFCSASEKTNDKNEDNVPRRSRQLILVALQHLARATILGRADDALLLKQVDQLRGFAVADPEPALEKRGRGALVLLDQLYRHRQQLILLILAQEFGRP